MKTVVAHHIRELARALPAALVLESGRVFHGTALPTAEPTTEPSGSSGSSGSSGLSGAVGEVVFNTSMTGYQEVLTDPSYAGQIVVMTASHIGNTGINDEDMESRKPWCTGFVMRDATELPSNWRSRGGLGAYLARHGVAGITGVDTRALTRALRTGGAQRGVIILGAIGEAGAGDAAGDGGQALDVDRALKTAREWPSMKGQDLASVVSCQEPYVWPEDGAGALWQAPWDGASATGVGMSGEGRAAAVADRAPGRRFHVVAYDFGIKDNILRHLSRVGCKVTVVPAHTPAAQAMAMGADGFFLSNGPGDPAAVDYAIGHVRQLLDSGTPVFGICLGHQILSLALGARTYKLPFGHHGGNHPVKDLSTGKVAITAQNHGFAVDADSFPSGVRCTHLNLYDQTVEGIAVEGRPIFGIQYHPEASPGPHDADGLFDAFIHAMEAQR